MHLIEVGKSPLCECSKEIERSGGLIIGLDKAVWVVLARDFVKRHIIYHIASIAWELYAISRFCITAAGLGELPCYAPYLDYGATRAKGEYRAHLDDDFEQIADMNGVEL